MNSRDFLSVQSCVLVSKRALGRWAGIGAHLVLVVGVLLYAALLGTFPVGGHALVDVCLVDDLGDQLRALADGGRVGGGQFGAQDGILTAVDDEQFQQGPDMVDCKAEQHDGGDQEYGDASPHGGGWGPPFFFWAVLSAGGPDAGSVVDSDVVMAAGLSRRHQGVLKALLGRERRGNEGRVDERACVGWLCTGRRRQWQRVAEIGAALDPTGPREPSDQAMSASQR